MGGQQERLHAAWQAGKYAEVGQWLAEVVPLRTRPRWAASLLATAAWTKSYDPVVDEVWDLATDRDRWGDAPELFERVRAIRLRTHPDEPTDVLLRLAELVAKVAYNATLPDYPYDRGAADDLVPAFMRAIQLGWGPEDEVDLWRVVSGQRLGIEL